MKVCSKCQVAQPFEGFYRQRAGRDGYTAACKMCEGKRKEAYKDQHRDKVLSQWQAATARWKEANRDKYLAGRRDNRTRAPRRVVQRVSRDERLAQQRAYRTANREKVRAKNAEWRAANPDKVRVMHQESAHRYRTRKREAFVEDVRTAVLFQRDKGRCGLCRRKVARRDASIDHIIPLSVGGPHSYANCQLAHRLCNVRRQHRGPAQTRLIP